ncbi:ATP-binding cassette domain-containing protein [Bradyrhizobium diazoefficiens]|uniref:ATP-binding cassette domain-containing protein n=1 Tax=Bradyrhizobium diazoefficiens TaxID=1355477 RepID=UPI00348E2D43
MSHQAHRLTVLSPKGAPSARAEKNLRDLEGAPQRDDDHRGRDPFIKVEGVSKVFGADEKRVAHRMRRGQSFLVSAEAEGVRPPLINIDLDVAKGEIFVIMGLSGSGKSTLIRCINGLIPPTAGKVTVGGVAVSSALPTELRELRQRRMAMVFQSFALLPHMSVLANVEFGLMLRQEDPRSRRKRAEEVVEMVGLSAWKDRRIDELSGGMRQRVGLARALAPDPEILLMDEPFSALDPIIRRSLQDELLRLQSDLKKTILFVTHDFAEAARIGSRILIMKEGAAIQVGTALELFRDPCDEYVRAFTAHVDRMQLLSADDLARELPLTSNDDANNAQLITNVDPSMSLAELVSRLQSGGHVSIGDREGPSRRLISAERVWEMISALYRSRSELRHG